MLTGEGSTRRPRRGLGIFGDRDSAAAPTNDPGEPGKGLGLEVQCWVGIKHFEGMAWEHLLPYLMPSKEKVHRIAIQKLELIVRYRVIEVNILRL